ncbi:hypothetical protein ACLOJK_039073 [Asimina triloba]
MFFTMDVSWWRSWDHGVAAGCPRDGRELLGRAAAGVMVCGMAHVMGHVVVRRRTGCWMIWVLAAAGGCDELLAGVMVELATGCWSVEDGRWHGRSLAAGSLDRAEGATMDADHGRDGLPGRKRW